MGHNFVLLKAGTNITGFANEAASAGEAVDWIPNDGAQVIAHTKMLGGGQTDVITFEAPEPGTYDYICSFPGHSGMMRGTLTVAP
jgi:azurin